MKRSSNVSSPVSGITRSRSSQDSSRRGRTRSPSSSRCWNIFKLPARLDGLTSSISGRGTDFTASRPSVAAQGEWSPTTHTRGLLRILDRQGLLGSSVEYVKGSVYDLSAKVVGRLRRRALRRRVLYHLRYPLLAMDRIHDVCDGYMVLETHCLDNRVILDDGRGDDPGSDRSVSRRIPLYRFYPANELKETTATGSPRIGARSKRASGPQASALRFSREWGDRVAYRAERIAGVPGVSAGNL